MIRTSKEIVLPFAGVIDPDATAAALRDMAHLVSVASPFFGLPMLPQHERPKSWRRSTWAILHWPRAMFVYSFLTWGAVLAPGFSWELLAWSFVAFFGALQLAAYSLDELEGRHVGTSISDRELRGRAVLGVLIAIPIGTYLTFTVTWLILPFWLFGLFVVFAYNSEWWRGPTGRAPFHNSAWFGITWGSLVVLGSYFLHGGIPNSYSQFLVLTWSPRSGAAVGMAVAAYYLAHEEIRSYGNTGCRQSNFCQDYARDRGTTLCHGQLCVGRLHMPKAVTRLQVEILRARWAAVAFLTVGLLLWRLS